VPFMPNHIPVPIPLAFVHGFILKRVADLTDSRLAIRIVDKIVSHALETKMPGNLESFFHAAQIYLAFIPVYKTAAGSPKIFGTVETPKSKSPVSNYRDSGIKAIPRIKSWNKT